MLTVQDAVRRVYAEHMGSHPSVVVSQVWGDEQRYVVFVDVPDPFGGPPGRGWAFTVDAETGEATRHDPDADANDLLDGLTRIAWKPYRPCDPEVTSARIRLCPICRGRLVPIVWGMPGPELIAAYERGEVVLGGCVIVFEPPIEVKACAQCGWTLTVEPNIP